MNKRGVLGFLHELFLKGKSYDNAYLELSLLSATDIMTRDVATISSTKPLSEAAHLMIASHISCLVVTQNYKPIGIITERDFIKKLDMEKQQKKERLIDELMSKKLHSANSTTGLFHAMRIMADNNMRKLIIIENEELAGIMTQTDLCRAINNLSTKIIDAPLVKDVMTKKLLIAFPDDSFSSIKKLMSQKDMGSVIVVKNNSIEGMFTEFDIVSEYFMNPNKLKNSRMKDLMTYPVVCISPDFDLVFVNKLMMEKGFRRLPVMSDGKIVGILTQTDVARKMYEHIEKNKDKKYEKNWKAKEVLFDIIKKDKMIYYQKK